MHKKEGFVTKYWGVSKCKKKFSVTSADSQTYRNSSNTKPGKGKNKQAEHDLTKKIRNINLERHKGTYATTIFKSLENKEKELWNISRRSEYLLYEHCIPQMDERRVHKASVRKVRNVQKSLFGKLILISATKSSHKIFL